MTYVPQKKTISENMKWVTGLISDPARGASFLEQGAISLTNFIALLVLARSFSEEIFGIFSYAYITTLFLINLHRSIVVVPFVIHTAERDVLMAEGLFWQVLNFLTTAAAVLLLVAGWLLADPFGAPPWMHQSLLTAVLFVAPAFYYEFLRRWVIQLSDYRRVVRAAFCYGLVYVTGIGCALLFHSLHVAVGAFILANLAAGAVCLPAVMHSELRRPAQSFFSFMADLRHFVTWSLFSNLAYNGYNHLPPLILGSLAGPVPVAAFQAIRTLTQPITTIATAIDNFDKPRAAREMARNGIDGMQRQLLRTTLSLFLLGSPYLIALSIFNQPVVDFLYSNRYSEFDYLIYYWVGLNIASMAVYPFETGLFLVRRPDMLFKGRIISAAVSIFICAVTVPLWGVVGAMAGLLTGTLLSGVYAMIYLNRVTRCSNEA